MFEHEHGIIVACDVDDMEALKQLYDATHDIEGIVGYKIGANLALQYGLKNIMEEVKFSLPVIYDHQKAGTDIPRMGEKFARACRNAGVKGVIIFPQAGPESEKAFIDSIIANEMVPMVGGEMTHTAYLAEEGGFLKDDAPSRIYEIAAKKGVEYFILPGNREEAMKRYHLLISGMINEPKYCMPGIGTQGGSVTKAFSILRGCPAYAIVGSAIYKSRDMRNAAQKFAREAMEFE